jgi:hypothetical protein
LLPIVKVYKPGAVHYASEVVTFEGATFQAGNDTGRAPDNTDDWVCLAAAGQPGRDGRVPTPRGTFDIAATYAALDIVALEGASFIALRDDPGACPGDGWQLLVRQGKRGTAGACGERGERGPSGAPGAAGEPGKAAAKIAGWKIDQAAYTATPLISDGSKGPAIELRALFKQFQDETT